MHYDLDIIAALSYKDIQITFLTKFFVISILVARGDLDLGTEHFENRWYRATTPMARASCRCDFHKSIDLNCIGI